MPSVDTVVQFFPRGGSAQVIRYLGHQFTARGFSYRIMCGSLGTSGMSHARSFYDGLEVSAMDYTAAAAAYTGGSTAMDDQPAPFHPSFEDRGPAAPDRMFTAVSPATTHHLINAWARHLTAHRTARPDLVHLHHLSHLQQAVHRAYPGVPVITTFHGTDLKLLDQAQRITRLAERIGVPLTALADARAQPDARQPLHGRSLDQLALAADLTAQDADLLHTTDWRLWAHADTWTAQMREHLHRAGRLVVVSDSDAAEVSRLLEVPASEVTVVPNGVDTTHFTPRHLTDAERLSLLRRWLVDDPQGWAPGAAPGSIRYTDEDLRRFSDPTGRLRPIILWVGRYQRVKRLDVLLEAFAGLLKESSTPPVLLLWGGYPGEAEGEHPFDTVRRLGIDEHVLFVGWRGHDELPAGLQCADLFAAPAVNESFGMVYIEAQACGTPPIATRTGGPATLITGHGADADGWTVHPDDPRDLTDAMAAALADPAERARRAANGADHARARYSWPTIADRYQAIYDTERR